MSLLSLKNHQIHVLINALVKVERNVLIYKVSIFQVNFPNQNDGLVIISEAPVLVSDNKTSCDCNKWKIVSLQEIYLNLSVCEAW